MDKNKKKYYYGFLAIMVLVALTFFISEGGYDQVRRSTVKNCINFARQCRKWKLYQLSNLNCRIALKLSPDIKYMNFAIAYNDFLDARDTSNQIRKKKLANEAIVLYREESKLHPDDYSIYQNIGATYELLEEYDKSVTNYEYAIKLNEKDSYSYGRLAYLDTHVYRKYDEALEYMDKYFKYEKKPVGEDYFQKAYILSSLERYKEAIEYYNKYLEIHPNTVAALVNISGCEVEAQDYENAEKHVELGLKYNSTSSYLLSHKIDILIHKRDFEKAEEITNRMIDRNKYNGYIGYWKLAVIERLKGNQSKAEEYYQMSKDNAQEYFDKYCSGKGYDLTDFDGKCSNRYDHLENFEKEKAKPIKL